MFFRKIFLALFFISVSAFAQEQKASVDAQPQKKEAQSADASLKVNNGKILKDISLEPRKLQHQNGTTSSGGIEKDITQAIQVFNERNSALDKAKKITLDNDDKNLKEASKKIAQTLSKNGKDDQQNQKNDAPKVEPKDVIPEAVILPVSVDSQKNGDFVFKFPWKKPVANVTFQRGKVLYIVFDHPAALQLDADVEKKLGPGVKVEQVYHQRAAVLRLSKNAFFADVERHGNSWSVSLSTKQKEIINFLKPLKKALPDGSDGLFFNVEAARPYLRFRDENFFGDELLLQPLETPNSSLRDYKESVQFVFLPSIQGVVVRPLVDGLVLNSTENGFYIAHKNGLLLSDFVAMKKRQIPPIFMPTDLSLLSKDQWEKRRSFFFNIITRSSGQEKLEAQLELARFYLTSAMPVEAQTILTAIGQDFPQAETSSEFKILRGVSHLLNKKPDLAVKDLSSGYFKEDPQIKGFLGVAYYQVGQVALAQKFIEEGDVLLKNYPKAFRHTFALDLFEASIHTGALKKAEELKKILSDFSLPELSKGNFLILKGQYYQAKAIPEKALKTWKDAQKSSYLDIKNHAKYLSLMLQVSQKKIDEMDAFRDLEKLYISVPGKSYTDDLLRKLATLAFALKKHDKSLFYAKEILERYPEIKDETVRQQIIDSLQAVLKDEKIPVYRQLSLLDEYKDYIPNNTNGDELVEHLVERLFATTLYQQAVFLLENRIRLVGTARAHAALDKLLFQSYFLNKQPEKAIKVFDGLDQKSKQSDVLKLIKAKAFVQLNKNDEALEILKSLHDEESIELRKSIYRRKDNWRGIADVLEEEISSIKNVEDKKQKIKQQRLILNLAMALHLASDEKGLKECRDKYLMMMDYSEFKELFRLIVAQIDPNKPRTRAEIQKRLQQVDQYNAFVDGYKKFTK